MSVLGSVVRFFKWPGDFNHFLIVELFVVVSVVALGTYGFHMVEWWALFDSLYFIFVTMATIGYWDFVPVTTIGKALTMLYAVMWVPLFVYTTSMILDYRFKNYMQRSIDLMKLQQTQIDEVDQKHNQKQYSWIEWIKNFFGFAIDNWAQNKDVKEIESKTSSGSDMEPEETLSQ